jgi:hypothetical protein
MIVTYHKREMCSEVNKANYETKPTAMYNYNKNTEASDLKDLILQPCLSERKVLRGT